MTTSRKRSTGRSAASGTTSRRTTSARRRTTSTTRRRTPAVSTTLGTALGTLVVTFLLDASWPVRIGLVVLVLAVGLGYLLWSHRAEIARGAVGQPAPDDGDAHSSAS